MNKTLALGKKFLKRIELVLALTVMVILSPLGIAVHLLSAFTLLTKEERELLRRHKRFRRAQESLGMMSDGEIELLEFANMQALMRNPDLSKTARAMAFSGRERREQHVKEEWRLVQEEVKAKGISDWKLKDFG